MFIDTHCHLNFKAFRNDLDEVIKRAHESGVEKIIIPGAKLDSSKKAVEIADTYENCFAAIGIHPHHVNEYVQKGPHIIEAELTELSQKSKVVAIGEIGLDYHQYSDYPPISDETKTLQKELFELQLNVAIQGNLPVIIHCREAQNDIIETIKQLQNDNLRCVFHCFDGNKEYLNKVLALGFYVGFDGNSTYEQNSHLRHLIAATPLDRLLLETDAPYLTPVPFRGSRNEPSNISHIAAFIAQLLEVSEDFIASQTTRNAKALFHLNHPPMLK